MKSDLVYYLDQSRKKICYAGKDNRCIIIFALIIVQSKAYQLLQPTAEKIMSLYDRNSAVVWTPQRDVRDMVDDANELLNIFDKKL